MALLHEEDVATRGAAVCLGAISQTFILQVATSTMVHASGEGDGVAPTVIPLGERDEVLHGVEAERVNVVHLVVELLGSWHDGSWTAQQRAVHVDQQRVAPAIAVDLEAAPNARARADRACKAHVTVGRHVGEARSSDEDRVEVRVTYVRNRLLAEGQGHSSLIFLVADELRAPDLGVEVEGDAGVARRKGEWAPGPPIRRTVRKSCLGSVHLRVVHANAAAVRFCENLRVFQRELDFRHVVTLRIRPSCPVIDPYVAVQKFHATCDAVGHIA
mmetsp:Transcript_122083/g.296327  ORF Transcript_122083/g.296327 Transcript_122083/m.296327 type:complete len:273 (+) Transcript_122083:2389-3207(+)